MSTMRTRIAECKLNGYGLEADLIENPGSISAYDERYIRILIKTPEGKTLMTTLGLHEVRKKPEGLEGS